MIHNMAGQWSIGLLALAVLPWAQALPSPTPLPTITQLSVVSTPSPTPAQTLHDRAIQYRATDSDSDSDSDDSISTSTSTSTKSKSKSTSTTTTTTTAPAPASVCGYVDFYWLDDDPLPITCKSDQNCVFHTPASDIPGMAGCCPKSKSKDCVFKPTCYDAEKFQVTPGLRTSTDPMALTCTNKYPYCVAYIFSSLHITSYECDEFRTEIDVELMSRSRGSETVFIATVDISTVDDDFIRSWSTGTPTATPEVKQHSATPSPTASSSTGPDAGSSKGSSTSGGIIAGSVVGSIAGVSAIVGAGVMFVLFKKRRGERNDLAPDGQVREGYHWVPNPNDGSSPGWELDQPRKADGAPQQDINEMEGSRPVYNFSDRAGRRSTNQAFEMDGRDQISELPVGRTPI